VNVCTLHHEALSGRRNDPRVYIWISWEQIMSEVERHLLCYSILMVVIMIVKGNAEFTLN